MKICCQKTYKQTLEEVIELIKKHEIRDINMLLEALLYAKILLEKKMDKEKINNVGESEGISPSKSF